MGTDRGKRHVTIKDVALASDVSIATVSRVLNHIGGSCSAETEARILQAAERLGYAPNVMARSLVTQKTGLVAVLIPDIHYYFYQEFYFGLEEYFNRYGIRAILCTTLQSVRREKEYIQNMSNGLVDGMIVATLNSAEDNSEIIKLAGKGFPLVLVERYGKDVEHICNVCQDNRLAAELAVDYLYQNGHRRIAYISGPTDAYNSQQRYQGYLDGLKKHNLPLVETLIVQADYQFEKSFEKTRELVTSEEFTALIAANDLMCVGACKALDKLNKRIPEDISVVGLDNTAYMELHQPPLSAVNFSSSEMGTRAAKCLKQLMDGEPIEKSKCVFKPKLEVRKSVRSLAHSSQTDSGK